MIDPKVQCGTIKYWEYSSRFYHVLKNPSSVKVYLATFCGISQKSRKSWMKNSLVRFLFLQKQGISTFAPGRPMHPWIHGVFSGIFLLLKWQGKNLFIHKCQVGEQVFLTQLNKSSWVNRYCLSMLAWINIVNCQISYTTGYHFKHIDIIDDVQIVTSTYFQHVKCMTKTGHQLFQLFHPRHKDKAPMKTERSKSPIPKKPSANFGRRNPWIQRQKFGEESSQRFVFFSLDFISEINKCQEDLKGQKNNLLLKVIFHLDFFSRHKTTNFKIAKQTQGPQCLDMFLIYPFSWENIFHKGFMG